MIDNVKIKGSEQPLELFTCDVDISTIQLEPVQNRQTRKEAKLKRVK